MSGDGSSSTKAARPAKEKSSRFPWVTAYFILAGIVLLIAAAWAIVKGSDTAAAALALLGGGAFILAPFAPNIEGTLKLGGVEVPIRRRLAGAVAKAPTEEVQAVLSILESRDVSLELIPFPPRFDGQTLRTGADLQTWRPDHGLSVIGVRDPGDAGWIAGGKVTDMTLREGMMLLVAGPPKELEWLRSQ